MTHEELLANINEYVTQCEEGIRMEGEQGYKALRAVVKLHQQLDDNSCKDCVTWYPCPTIQAIEKELK